MFVPHGTSHLPLPSTNACIITLDERNVTSRSMYYDKPWMEAHNIVI